MISLGKTDAWIYACTDLECLMARNLDLDID